MNKARTIEAEARAVEEGHRAFILPGGAVKVVSDSKPGKWFRVTFHTLGRASRDGHRLPIVFRCEPVGPGAFNDDHGRCVGEAGTLPCKHAGLAARRLERARLAAFDADAGWVSLIDAEIEAQRELEQSDPFAGLPGC